MSRPRDLGVLLAFALLALAGCRKECEQNLNCPASEICTDGKCVMRACADSNTCPMEHFCSDESGTCVAGCQSDRDCYPYHRCNDEGRCVENDCRNTALDCAVGQFCNELTGECYDSGGAYCAACDIDDDCGGTNWCLDIGAPSGQRYCLVDCSLGQECPRGYQCTTITRAGAPVGEGCIARCWEL